MPVNTSAIPYDIAFAVLLALVAVLSGTRLAAVARIFIVAFIPFSLAMSIYYLVRDPNTWRVAPNGTLTDAQRYSCAARRSSAVYIIMNIILLAGAKIFKLSYSSVSYNYASLFVTAMIAYLYDRCISTDDGLMHFRQQPGRTILDSYLSFCSPSFMRYLIVLACEIPLMVVAAYYLGALIPPQCKLASTLFRKSIIPIVIFSIVGSPLRFAWAYPTIAKPERVPYLSAYIIAFTVLAIITYASGRVDASSAAGVLVLVGLIAMILQTGGLSNAPADPDVFDDADVMPLWVMLILSTVILLSTLVIAYRIFKCYLQPYLQVPPPDYSCQQKMPPVRVSRCKRQYNDR